MLSHQLAAGHRATMKLMHHLDRAMERMSVLKEDLRAQANIEAIRLVGGISRLMTTSQQGALTLQKLKSGGKQHVVVQHVNVESGGQAIVAGAVGPGGGQARGEGKSKMRDEPHGPWAWDLKAEGPAAVRRKERSTGCACRKPAMANGRCRIAWWPRARDRDSSRPRAQPQGPLGSWALFAGDDRSPAGGAHPNARTG